MFIEDGVIRDNKQGVIATVNEKVFGTLSSVITNPEKLHHLPKHFNLETIMNLKHYRWWLFDSFHTCNKAQMWKVGSPRMSGRCFPSADMQKLRLTLFWTERTRKCAELWQRFNADIRFTPDTSNALAYFLDALS